jgi:hypothetical protein
MKLPLRTLFTVLAFNASAFSADPVPLFDGRTFEGWEGDTENTWRIEDGTITAGSLEQKQPRNEFLATKKSYSDFELKFKCKLIGKEGTGFINSGVQIRSERVPDHHELIGYQADIGDPKYWGALYDESRRKITLAETDMTKVEPVLKRGDWNEFTVRCEGPRIRIWVNGVQTVDYTEEDKTIPLTGKIAVQIHGNGNTVVWFKDLVVTELR